MLTRADLIRYQQLAITPDCLQLMRLQRVADREARDVLGINGRPGRLDGILFPYFVPWLDDVRTHRLRRDHPEMEDGKPKNKYLSAYGDRRHLYFCPTDPPLLDAPSVPVLFVEA